MKTRKTLITKVDVNSDVNPLQISTRKFLECMAFKHDAPIDKLLVGMSHGCMVVQKYDTGSYPVWQTLEIIEFD